MVALGMNKMNNKKAMDISSFAISVN